MAIFERQAVNKVIIDDTISLTCVIENWRHVNGHTEFTIKVQRGPFAEQSWYIYKRYNDFHKLHTALQLSGIELQLPPKRFLGNFQPEFIIERQQGLQKYLNTILMNPILASSLPTRSFVDPANYCQPFGELALQHVSLALRGEVGWEVIGPLTDIGWRLRKHYYQIRCKSMPNDELLGSWTDYGPDKYLDDKDLHLLFKYLNQLRHHFIHSIELCLCTDTGGLFVRNYYKNGTLRDLLCCAKPKQSFLKKYGNPKGHKPLQIKQVAYYGKQILEALKFLHDNGLPYGHLHTGNVIVLENDQIQLLDIENGILGVPSFYRPYFMQHRKINSLEAVDVYCFGHTLYEMVFGAPLHKSIVDEFPECPDNLKNILISILSSEACKSGLPTINSLLNNEFFSTVVLNNIIIINKKPNCKLTNSVKEHLKLATLKIEEHLKDDQKMVRSQKRFAKVQEMMSCEEEKKKQRHKLKHDQKSKEKQDQDKQKKDKTEKLNGNNNRSNNSVNSSSTTVSLGTATPPSTIVSNIPSPPPPPPPPPQPPPLISQTTIESGNLPPISTERAALLGAICNFNKINLRKTKVT